MRAPYQCGNCGEKGHNRATCKNPAKPKAQTASKSRVYKKRTSQDIENRFPGISEKLKTTPNVQVALEYGISRERARKIREELKIPKLQAKSLPPEGLAMLGVFSDAHIAKRFELGPGLVRLLRIRRDISPVNPNDYYDSVINTLRDRVGVDSDPVLAEKLNISTQAVFKFRMRNNIPPARLHPRCKGFKPIDRDLVAELFKQGATDEEIAVAAKATPGSIANIRRELNLYRAPKKY